MHRKRTYKIQPYDVSLEIYFTDNPKSLAKKLRISNPDPEFDFNGVWGSSEKSPAAAIHDGMGGADQDTYTLFAIFDLNNSDDVCWPSLFAHEAVHVAGFLFHYSGSKFDFSNDEPFAYLVDYIVRLFVKTKQTVKNV